MSGALSQSLAASTGGEAGGVSSQVATVSHASGRVGVQQGSEGDPRSSQPQALGGQSSGLCPPTRVADPRVSVSRWSDFSFVHLFVFNDLP